MSARSQWRYIAWTRALDRGETVRAFLLGLARRLDDPRDGLTYYPRVCRLLDRVAGGIGPR